MIGPDAEYLGGGHAISGNAEKVRRQLREALDRFARLRKQKGYANKPVPRESVEYPPQFNDKPMLLQVFLRDLPRGRGDDSGRRFASADMNKRMWLQFTEWAWNQNWIAFDDPEVFVPRGAKEQEVDAKIVRHLYRKVLRDNVRGQNGDWRLEDLKQASLRMKRTGLGRGKLQIRYEGEAQMVAGDKRFAPRLYGEAVWDTRRKRFESFELLAIGVRAGAARFNQRGRDRKPAPMGIAIGLYSKD